jgi:hypothetical protein
MAFCWSGEATLFAGALMVPSVGPERSGVATELAAAEAGLWLSESGCSCENLAVARLAWRALTG